jgi:C1A family cysteine protease
MKLFRLFLVLCLLVPKLAFAAELSEKPITLNPDFVNYQKTKSLDKANNSSGEKGLGYIPVPILPDDKGFSSSGKSRSLNLDGHPATYDLRTTSRMSSVKDQGASNACWSFATAGALESKWLSLGESESNLSENNIKNCNKARYQQDVGGNYYISGSYLSTNLGPISEANDAFSLSTTCVSGLTPVTYVSNARFLPSTADIKQAVIDHGAIYTSFYWNSSYYNSGSNSYYYSGATATNHAVLIAGWDDNKVTAGGTGAWLIKNSWADTWGNAGYFYISYNDSKINSNGVAYWPTKITTSNSKKLYYYDEVGAFSSAGYGVDTAYGLSKFTISGNHRLTKVGTWSYDNNTTMDFQIYGTFDGTNLSNLLASATGVTAPYTGYYTFDLGSSIAVTDGQIVYVKARYTSVGSSYPLSIESKSDIESWGWDSPTIQTGKNWISSSGNNGSWTAIGTGSGYVWDLGIRIYGEGDPVSTPTPTPTPTSGATSSVYRFWSDQKQGHFYTASESEKDYVIANYPSYIWKYEQVGYKCFSSQQSGTVPLYRFWSDQKQGHFYTASESEKDYVIAHYPEYIWKYERIAFYVYPVGYTGPATTVYRFWSDRNQHHFYTTSAAERDYVIDNYPDDVWMYEREAYKVPN